MTEAPVTGPASHGAWATALAETAGIDDATAIAEIKSILAENARLLGEPQNTFCRRWRGGVRIQMKIAGRWASDRFQDYATPQSALAAGRIAHARAKAYEDGR